MKNEKLFTTRGLDIVVVQLENGDKVKRKKIHPICANLASLSNKVIP
jgi:hypothetical protein